MDHCANDQYLNLVEIAAPADGICRHQLQAIKLSFQASLLQIH